MSSPSIPLARPFLREEDIESVVETLRSGWLVQGPRVARFEAEVARRIGRRHAVAVSSGTAALQLALEALGIGKGDEVVCPNLTWPSPAHACCVLGATPVLVDVDEREWNLRGDVVESAITSRTKAVIAIPQFGNPLRSGEIRQAAGHIPIVEDAACALGAIGEDAPCGSLGVISCLSFHPRKILTTGEGGMCLTNDDDLADLLRTLRNHGQSSPGTFTAAATNYRLPEFSAALGLSQLEGLDSVIATHRRVRAWYQSRLQKLNVQQEPPGGRSNAQTVGVLLPKNCSRDELIAKAAARGVQFGRLSYALDLLDSLRERARPATTMNVSHALAHRGIALPVFVGISDDELEAVASVLEELSA